MKNLASPSVSLDGDGPAGTVKHPGMGEETGCQGSSCCVPCCLLRDKIEAANLFPGVGGVKVTVQGMSAHSSGRGRSGSLSSSSPHVLEGTGIRGFD